MAISRGHLEHDLTPAYAPYCLTPCFARSLADPARGYYTDIIFSSPGRKPSGTTWVCSTGFQQSKILYSLAFYVSTAVPAPSVLEPGHTPQPKPQRVRISN